MAPFTLDDHQFYERLLALPATRGNEFWWADTEYRAQHMAGGPVSAMFFKERLWRFWHMVNFLPVPPDVFCEIGLAVSNAAIPGPWVCRVIGLRAWGGFQGPREAFEAGVLVAANYNSLFGGGDGDDSAGGEKNQCWPPPRARVITLEGT